METSFTLRRLDPIKDRNIYWRLTSLYQESKNPFGKIPMGSPLRLSLTMLGFFDGCYLYHVDWPGHPPSTERDQTIEAFIRGQFANKTREDMLRLISSFSK